MTYTELSQAELDAIYARTRILGDALRAQLRDAGFKRQVNLLRRGSDTVAILGHPAGVRVSLNGEAAILTNLDEVGRWVTING